MIFTGGKVDNSVNDWRNPYIFRLYGQNHHKIGTLLPANGQNPQYAQLYFYDIENEVKYRMDVFHDSQTDSSIDPFIVVAWSECEMSQID